jgi:serine/threonine protein kinase
MLAEGAWGRVYEGVQEAPRRTVAVKLLRPGALSPAAMEQFLGQTEILGRLRHPWICQVYAAGTFEAAGARLPFYVMEHLPGALPITQYAADRSLDVVARLALAEKVCEAVAYAHAQGIVHYDLKPSNILVNEDGFPKIIDFGLAPSEQRGEVGSVSSPWEWRDGAALQYRSPEQCGPAGAALDERCDVYALGLMLYELLAGRPPYDVSALSPPEAAEAIWTATPERLETAAPGTSRRLANVVHWCLVKEPAQRCPSVATLRFGLTDWLERPDDETERREAVRDADVRATRRKGFVAAIVSLCAWATALWEWLWPERKPAPPIAAPRPGNASLTKPTRLFRYGFKHVFEPAADVYLVEVSGVKKWEDNFTSPPSSYWGPTRNDQEGRLTYRFEFPALARRVRLRAAVTGFDFTVPPDNRVRGSGRGLASVELSVDGQTWMQMFDGIGERLWGGRWQFDDELPAEVSRGRALWVRIRMYAEGTPETYMAAQFGRSTPEAAAEAFAVEAELQ